MFESLRFQMGSRKINIHKTLVIPVALYGCTTIMLQEINRLTMAEKRVMRIIFDPKRVK
jgi:hypothetical protein